MANYVRFVMSDFLSKDVTKVMWIDVDTILKCDVVQYVNSMLLDTDTEEESEEGESENALPAVAAVPKRGKLAGISKHYQHEITTSFNAGVMIYHLDRWRHQQLTSQVLSWVERNNNAKNEQEKIYGFGTQPPLALTIGEHFVSILYTYMLYV